MNMLIRQADPTDMPLLEKQVKAAFGRTFTKELVEQHQGIHSLFIAVDDADIFDWSFIRGLLLCIKNSAIRIHRSMRTTTNTITLSPEEAWGMLKTCAAIW